MGKKILPLLILSFVLVFSTSCTEEDIASAVGEIAEPVTGIPGEFYSKVSTDLQTTLITLLAESATSDKSFEELATEYATSLLPIDNYFRILVGIETLDNTILSQLEDLNCVLESQDGNKMSLWIPVSHFMDVVEMDDIVSVFAYNLLQNCN